MRRKLPDPLARLLDERSRGALFLTLAAWAVLAAWMRPGQHSHGAGFSASLSMWILMVVATAPVLLDETVRRLRLASLPRMRSLTANAFCLGYALPWAAAGILLWPALEWSHSPVAGSAFAAAIVIWHCSPARQRRVNACHRVPFPRAFGSTAVRDAGAFGLSMGANCAAACGPLMLLPFLAGGYQFPAMAAAAMLMILERKMLPRHPRWQLPLVRSLARELRVVPAPDPRWVSRRFSPAS